MKVFKMDSSNFEINQPFKNTPEYVKFAIEFQMKTPPKNTNIRFDKGSRKNGKVTNK